MVRAGRDACMMCEPREFSRGVWLGLADGWVGGWGDGCENGMGVIRID